MTEKGSLDNALTPQEPNAEQFYRDFSDEIKQSVTEFVGQALVPQLFYRYRHSYDTKVLTREQLQTLICERTSAVLMAATNYSLYNVAGIYMEEAIAGIPHPVLVGTYFLRLTEGTEHYSLVAAAKMEHGLGMADLGIYARNNQTVYHEVEYSEDEDEFLDEQLELLTELLSEEYQNYALVGEDSIVKGVENQALWVHFALAATDILGQGLDSTIEVEIDSLFEDPDTEVDDNDIELTPDDYDDLAANSEGVNNQFRSKADLLLNWAMSNYLLSFATAKEEVLNLEFETSSGVGYDDDPYIDATLDVVRIAVASYYMALKQSYSRSELSEHLDAFTEVVNDELGGNYQDTLTQLICKACLGIANTTTVSDELGRRIVSENFLGTGDLDPVTVDRTQAITKGLAAELTALIEETIADSAVSVSDDIVAEWLGEVLIDFIFDQYDLETESGIQQVNLDQVVRKTLDDILEGNRRFT